MAWNLAVIDEAHRLRNVYKPSNKIGNALKGALAPFDKLLLTATPLQNSLLELFGLVSIIDEHIFGDMKSFRSQFSRLDTDGDFQSLRERLKPICQRTLRWGFRTMPISVPGHADHPFRDDGDHDSGMMPITRSRMIPIS